MSEIVPPSGPDADGPKPPPHQDSRQKSPLGKGVCAVIGLALFVVSAVSCILFPPIGLLCLVGAFATLFIEGYRYIFVGYILSLLISVGLLFVAVIVICGNMHNSM